MARAAVEEAETEPLGGVRFDAGVCGGGGGAGAGAGVVGSAWVVCAWGEGVVSLKGWGTGVVGGWVVGDARSMERWFDGVMFKRVRNIDG